MRARPISLLAVSTLAAATAVLAPSASGATPQGSFGPLFEEPTGHDCTRAQDPAPACKPAAMAQAVLVNGKVAYWDGLEAMNKVQYNVVAEFGGVGVNDQSRVLDLAHRTWSVPSPERADVNGAPADEFLPLVPHKQGPGSDDLFCSALVQTADGKLLVAGGTDYYLEPGVDGSQFGATELQGLRATRYFDPKTQTWSAGPDMNHGRWYPELVTLADGRTFVASGVTKLIKPAYASHPADSGTNVEQTETLQGGRWVDNGTSAQRSLPLYPRLHLLPDGKVYYDAAGQTFNPSGQSYDEALWNTAAVYDPATRSWRDVGVPNFGPLPAAGFRGSGFSLLLPLSYKDGYTKATTLSAGGVYGVSPGAYVATDTSTLNTVDTAKGDAFSSTDGGKLNHARWYSTGVLLPDGQVMAVNGADRDEVVLPGSGTPVMQAELWDPATRTWHNDATLAADHGRTYHNTATLQPDGSVLIGGHAPIATGYAAQNDALHDNAGFSRPEADPTFQVYYPPYFKDPNRPTITGGDDAVLTGGELHLQTPQAGSVDSVVLVRNPALTHLVDGDQRTVELRITHQEDGEVTATVPGGTVVPPGPYLAFVRTRSGDRLLPAKQAHQVLVELPGSPTARALGLGEDAQVGADRARVGARHDARPAHGAAAAQAAATHRRRSAHRRARKH